MEPITVCCNAPVWCVPALSPAFLFINIVDMCVSQKMETGACSRLGTRFRTKSVISFSNNARSAQYGRDTCFWLPAANTTVIRDAGERMRSERAGVGEGGFT